MFTQQFSTVQCEQMINNHGYEVVELSDVQFPSWALRNEQGAIMNSYDNPADAIADGCNYLHLNG